MSAQNILLKTKILRRARDLTPQFLRTAYRKIIPANMDLAFQRVYAEDQWGGGSGRGSTPSNTELYRNLIEQFVRKHNIQSVVDAGCGDWQSTQLINWGDAEYLGLDVVPSLISQNSEKFGPRYNFKLLDFSKSELPRADLALFKDVLQHWPTKTILHLLPMLDVYKYVIITNSINGQAAINSDIAMAGYRPIDLRLPPFNFGAEELLRYKTDEVGQNDPPNKLVLLYRPQSSRA